MVIILLVTLWKDLNLPHWVLSNTAEHLGSHIQDLIMWLPNTSLRKDKDSFTFKGPFTHPSPHTLSNKNTFTEDFSAFSTSLQVAFTVDIIHCLSLYNFYFINYFVIFYGLYRCPVITGSNFTRFSIQNIQEVSNKL